MSDFQITPTKPGPLGPETHPWFWNPNREPMRRAPEDFNKKLRELDPDLRAVWNPHQERWTLWVKAPRINYPLCHGWRLLFIHHSASGEYLSLDETFLARIYTIDSQRVGNAKQYFDRISSEMERDRLNKEAAFTAETIDRGMSQWDYSRIKNIGTGNKFSEFHS